MHHICACSHAGEFHAERLDAWHKPHAPDRSHLHLCIWSPFMHRHSQLGPFLGLHGFRDLVAPAPLPPHQGADPHLSLPHRGRNTDAKAAVLCRSHDQCLSTPHNHTGSRLRITCLWPQCPQIQGLLHAQAPSPGLEAKQLATVPQLARLGAPFRSTPPALLTEEETEYHVTLTKHVFPAHLVLQFSCTNTVPEQMLEGVTVAVDLAESVRPARL